MFGELLERRTGFYGPDDCLLVAETAKPPWVLLHVHGLWTASPALRECLAALAQRNR